MEDQTTAHLAEPGVELPPAGGVRREGLGRELAGDEAALPAEMSGE